MKFAIVTAALVLAATPVFAQPAGMEIDTETPQGALLQQIGLQKNTGIKLQMLEQFARQYPDDKAIVWVLAQIPGAYVKLKHPDKALAACDRLLQKDPANATGAHGCLKIAEGEKNPDLIKKWAVMTHEASAKILAAPKPKFEYEDEETAWKQKIEFAKEVGTYAEYALYAATLETSDPAKKIELGNALIKMNANSKYVPQVIPQIFLAYRQAGNEAKALEIAQQEIANNRADDDMLLVAANYYLNTKKDPAKVLEYSAKLITMLESKQAPKGMPPETWAKKKNETLGMAYWMEGVTYSTQRKYLSADKALRKAFPKIKDNPQLKAAALFHLGLANFQLGNKSGNKKRILAGYRYTKECAAMKSPFQAQARRNLAAIRSQYRIR